MTPTRSNSVKSLLAWLGANRPALVASACALAVFVGLWIERPSLALIVCGVAGFTFVARTHLRGGYR